MKRVVIFIAVLCGGIGFANAAVRSASTTTQQSRTTSATTTTQSRTTAGTVQTPRTTTSRTATSRTKTVSPRTTSTTTQSPRAATTSRATPTNTSRTATSRARTATTTGGTTSRAATNKTSRLSRAALLTASAAGSNTFGTGYNACRDAYFTCMDQFCATMNDTYRRCICSSRLTEIRDRERTLSQAGDQLQDFKDLNLSVIDKTGAEVKAMLSATAGESAIKTDKSQSAQTLANISNVLSNARSKALSTQGTLDIAGDINAVWATTDLASGSNLANLEGEALYNAVHSQCVDLVSKNCPGAAMLNMVVSAYGMYIENDCTTLNTAIDKKYNAANSAVRETQSQMHDARLENYNAHNSASINECIAQVRQDITADTACGADYVHCMDITGKYLNRDTGAAIYTPQFFEIENSVSLSGDVLTNPTNRLLVAELNNKKVFAARALNTCTDLADDVWDEFMRQAITEIYQGQRERTRQVRNECLDVVNQCYETQSSQLRDFSNQKDQLLIGARLELSEEMCKTKLDACANLYGGGSDGLAELVQTMREITDQQIARDCRTTLLEYTTDICSVTGMDTLHQYPWGCRTYVPGEQRFALIAQCNTTMQTDMGYTGDDNQDITSKEPFIVTDPKIEQSITFENCGDGYYLEATGTGNNKWCKPCPDGYVCNGGTQQPIQKSEAPNISAARAECGDYSGSLYHHLVRYAMQACVRPSESTNPLPTSILTDINSVMDSVRSNMGTALAAECDRLGGEWHSEPNAKSSITLDSTNLSPKNACTTSGGTWQASNTQAGGNCKCPNNLFLNDIGQCEYKKLDKFYSDTGANTQWGICADADEENIATAQSAANLQYKKDRCATDGGKWDSTGVTCDCPTGTIWNNNNNECK